jgi:hypothetical protein
MLIDFGRAPQSHEERLEPWAWSIGQADLEGVAALEARLHKRLELLRAREWANDIEREALILCAQRRAELLAGAHAAPSPVAPGGSPAVQAAHGATRPAQETW